MLSAAEQTRYSPWTGQSGNAAFNNAAQEDPWGNTLKGIAGTIGSGAAQAAAKDKYEGLLNALKSAKTPMAGDITTAADSPLGGAELAKNLSSDFQLNLDPEEKYVPWSKMYSFR